MRLFLIVFILSFGVLAQRLPENTVEEIILNKVSVADEIYRSSKDYDDKIRYQLAKISKYKIKKAGVIKVNFSYQRTRIDTKKKLISKYNWKKLKDFKYNPTRFQGYSYEAECEDFKTMTIAIRMKLLDPVDDMKRVPRVRYSEQTIQRRLQIDTKKYCNGYVPTTVIIDSNLNK